MKCLMFLLYQEFWVFDFSHMDEVIRTFESIECVDSPFLHSLKTFKPTIVLARIFSIRVGRTLVCVRGCN